MTNDTPNLTASQDDSSFAGFLSWEAASRDTIDFKKIYVDMAGDLVAGLLLSQIVYWYLPDQYGNSKLRVFKDGHYWIAKQREDWWNEVRITAKQFDRASKILAALGLIEKKNFMFNGLRTVHVRLKQSEFMAAWSAKIEEGLYQRETPVFTFGKDRSLPKGKTGNDESGRPITEITAKTTPETTTETTTIAAVDSDETQVDLPSEKKAVVVEKEFLKNLQVLGLKRNRRTEKLPADVLGRWAAAADRVTDIPTGAIITYIEQGDDPPPSPAAETATDSGPYGYPEGRLSPGQLKQLDRWRAQREGNMTPGEMAQAANQINVRRGLPTAR